MIDVNRLRVLVALDEEGTLAGAADGLGYAQATATHHLQRLQSETGAVLVTHVGRRLRLTHEGRYLADQGRALLASLDRVERELQSMTDLASGVVRLAAFPSAVAVVVPAVLAALAERAPGLELQVVDAEPPEALQMLRRGDVDLALTFSYPEGSDDDAVRRLDLGDDLLHLIEPAAARAGTGGGDAQAGAGAVADGADEVADGADEVADGADEVADLGPWRDATWVTGCERCRAHLTSACADAGFEPVVGYASDDYVAVQALVAARGGVGLLPRMALEAFTHPGVRTRPVRAQKRVVSVCTAGAPPYGPAVDLVLEVIAQRGWEG